jgi:hypothetical protein
MNISGGAEFLTDQLVDVCRIDIRNFGQCGRRKRRASILANQTGNVITHPAFKNGDGFAGGRNALKACRRSAADIQNTPDKQPHWYTFTPPFGTFCLRLSTPEEKCIGFPEQKYISEAGKKGR